MVVPVRELGAPQPNQLWPYLKHSMKTATPPDTHYEYRPPIEDYVQMPQAYAQLFTVQRMADSDERSLVAAALAEDQLAAKRRSRRGQQPNRCLADPAHAVSSDLAAQVQRLNPGYYTALLLLVLEGTCSPQDALRLEWDEVDIHSGTVFLRVGDSDAYRPAPISAGLCFVFAQLPLASHRVFPLNLRHVESAWKRITERADRGFISLADLQAEGAWRMLEMVRTTSVFALEAIPDVWGRAPGAGALPKPAANLTEDVLRNAARRSWPSPWSVADFRNTPEGATTSNGRPGF